MNTTFFQKASENKRSISWGDIFSDVWKKHRKDQRTALLTKGMGSHIPAPNRMLSDWQKPWLFARILIAGLILSVLIGISCVIFPGYGMLLMLCLLPAFVVPLSVMLFYWEMNIPGNISIYEALLLTLLGGCLSLTVTGIMRTVFPGISEIAFLAGPLPEELAKCLIVTIFLCRKKYNYGLQGILIGGAVGVGFSAMESAGYALQIFDIGIQNAMGTNIIIRSMADILVRRGVLAIGGHVVWAALYGGALALIKGKGKMSPKCFANSLFWLTFSAAFLLHTAWNFSASYLAGKLPDSLVASLVKFEAGTVTQWVKYIVLIILAWLLLFYIMKKSIRQMVSVDEMYHNAANSAEAVIQGVSGLLNGKTYMLTAGTPLIFGRRTEKCNVLFKNETKGISSLHCEIKWYNGKVLIKDLGSTYGTWLNEGTRLEPNKYYELPDQGVFYLGSKENMFFMGMK
ncbi:MAG: PrsW family glutamic-type intramembrane protease [Anaerobutyricum hallii]|uniref:PrsW family glutamic-type intramembrane protease n=1 Tax=Anaerobutyricum hallii TaxID=39488 RepID=UPI002A828A69|nr:PrsW family glutamic-type intramembrane protease [Anaerobutyricum hallii]MDY4577458.1 PrsW family glutamic-type intramembrane protease [Anaerobutyricum hallii]